MGEELPTAVQDSAWIATGTFAQARGGAANVFDSDCNNFTVGTSGAILGMRVSLSNQVGAGSISDADCSAQLPILCCDY